MLDTVLPRKNANKKTDEEGIVDFTAFYDGISLLKFGKKEIHTKRYYTDQRQSLHRLACQLWSWKWGAECECDLLGYGDSTGPIYEQFERFDYIYGIAKDRSLSIIYLNEDSEEVCLTY